MVRATVRREQVEYAKTRGMSYRFACRLFSVARSTLGYQSRQDARDQPILARMKSLSDQYPRYGCRMVSYFLKREGFFLNPKRAHRLWRLGGFQVSKKRPRRRLAASRPRPQIPTEKNNVWAYDFVHDACANGQSLKCLTVVDEFTHEALAIEVDGSIRSGRVIDVLSRLISLHGAPKYLRSDNGPEFISLAVMQWLNDQEIETAYIAPGKPWQNGVVESFNGRFRDECLSMEWFRTRREARVIIENWRRHYNAVRPHSSLGGLTPHEFTKQYVVPTIPRGSAFK
jgi:putative transposase